MDNIKIQFKQGASEVQIMDFIQQNMTVCSGPEQDIRCPSCGAYPGQYHRLGYNRNKSDRKEEDQK